MYKFDIDLFAYFRNMIVLRKLGACFVVCCTRVIFPLTGNVISFILNIDMMMDCAFRLQPVQSDDPR